MCEEFYNITQIFFPIFFCGLVLYLSTVFSMPNSNLKKKENYIWFQRPRLWGIIVSCFWQIFTWVWLNIHTPLFWIQIKGFKCSLLNKQLNFINYLCSSIISVKEDHQFKWKRICKVNKPPLFSDTILVAIASGKKIYYQWE